MSFDVLIVGAGQAGAATAMMLRQRGFAGTVGIFGEEPELPYERPPLSKEFLAGEKTFDRMLLRPASFYAEKSITVQTSARVTEVRPSEHEVTLADGTTAGYGKLVWATGGKPRRLTCSGHHLQGVHTVRTHADVVRMRAELAMTTRVVVVGGGYIGLEAAAVLRKLGKSVVVLEAQERVLARVAGAPLSRFYEDEHRAHGVEVRLGVSVTGIAEDAGRAVGVELAGGEVLSCEMVIVGVGLVPEVAPLLAAGAKGGNGVEVDALCRTTLPDVFAVGDCAAQPNRFADGARLRLESVQNANDQAATVAKLITGTEAPSDGVPWFWSNQYDLRLQTIGLATGHDRALVRGDVSTRSFSVVYLRGGRVVALDCVNSVKDYVQGKALVLAGTRIEGAAAEAQLLDVHVPLKTLLA